MVMYINILCSGEDATSAFLHIGPVSFWTSLTFSVLLLHFFSLSSFIPFQLSDLGTGLVCDPISQLHIFRRGKVRNLGNKLQKYHISKMRFPPLCCSCLCSGLIFVSILHSILSQDVEDNGLIFVTPKMDAFSGKDCFLVNLYKCRWMYNKK